MAYHSVLKRLLQLATLFLFIPKYLFVLTLNTLYKNVYTLDMLIFLFQKRQRTCRESHNIVLITSVRGMNKIGPVD